MNLASIIVPTAVFAMIFGIVYVITTAMHRENMALIEAGINPKDARKKKDSNLKGGLFFVFVPIGILVGNLTHHLFELEAAPAAVVFSFLFGGISLILAHLLEKKKNNSSSED